MKLLKWRNRLAPTAVLYGAFAANVSAQQVWYVDIDARGAETGLCWTDAFTDLHDALGVAQAGDEIWVARGVYKPDRGTGDRTMSFHLVSGVAVYGGFAGWETRRDQRDWVVNKTVLSGDLNGDDGPRNCAEVSNCCVEHDEPGCDDPECEALVCAGWPDCCKELNQYEDWVPLCVSIAREACCHLGTWNACENSLAVITAENTRRGTSLDGLSVEKSYGNGLRDGFDILVGGLLTLSSEIDIANCVFARNGAPPIAIYEGPAVRVVDTTFSANSGGISAGGLGQLVVEDCDFLDQEFGGIANLGPISVARCTFRGNKRSYALWNRGPTQIADSVFIDNAGRALELTGFGDVVNVTNCRFVRNGGGGVSIGEVAATLRDCEIVDNRNTALGGGFANVLVDNCLIAGNRVSHSPIMFTSGSLLLYNTTIAYNTGNSTLATALDLDEATAWITDSIIWGNQGGRPDTPAFEIDASSLQIDHSLVQNWDGSLGGVGNFEADPRFVPGADGDYYLSQTAAGNLADSPAVDAGSVTAASLGLDTLTTRGDETADAGMVDLGYHFPITGRPLVMGDADRNGRIDLADFAAFQNCFTADGPPEVPPWCRIFDFDGSSALTLEDFAAIGKSLSGP